MKKLRQTCLNVVSGICDAHGGGLVSQRHDQIKIRTDITALTVM
jgi:hypothetical protein